jgi:N-acetylneuraminate lyase
MLNYHLEGLIAAPFTPMHEDGSLYLELIPHYYAMLKANGVKGAFICGSTGEGVSLTLQEKINVAEAWAACTVNDKGFIVMQLVGGTCLEDCKTLALHARKVGIDAISFLPPYYFKPSSVEVLADCCKEVAAVVPDMPFYFYHIPVLTGVNYNMIDLLKAVDGQIPNFAGIKYTHEDFMDYLSCINYNGGKFDMLWGRDETFLSALAVGAKGAVGSTYNYAAPLYNQLVAAFDAGNLSEAQQLQQLSIDMIRLLGKYGGIATGKAYMKYIGLDCGGFRLPVKNMQPSTFEAFKDDVNRLPLAPYWSYLPVSTHP